MTHLPSFRAPSSPAWAARSFCDARPDAADIVSRSVIADLAKTVRLSIALKHLQSASRVRHVWDWSPDQEFGHFKTSTGVD